MEVQAEDDGGLAINKTTENVVYRLVDVQCVNFYHMAVIPLYTYF